MGRRGDELKFSNFTGGLASNFAITELAPNQALEADNVVVKSSGGFTNKRGNSAFNATAFNNGGTWVGLTYFQDSSFNKYLVGICGEKIGKTDNLDGTFDDITGTLILPNDPNSTWTLFSFSNSVIAFGGQPNAPWIWTGSGDATALSGSPPSASFGFSYNNRVFAGNTSANPSTIYWGILGSASDWTGTGSGSAVVGSLNDNQVLVGAAPLTTDRVLLFKSNSVYQMPTRNLVSTAFPIFPLHDKVGAAGKLAIVNVNDEVYFITATGRMMSTNGSRLQEYPDSVNDIWNSLNTTRFKYTHGFREQSIDHDWLVWVVTTGDGNRPNHAIVWDLVNECWLQCSMGYKCNVSAVTLDGIVYTGHFDGKVYQQDPENVYTVASESSAPIDWIWRIGWLRGDAAKTINPRLLNVLVTSQSTGTLDIGYGFDFKLDQKTTSLNIYAGTALWNTVKWNQFQWAGKYKTNKRKGLLGRGNVFNIALSGDDAVRYDIDSFNIFGKTNIAQKDAAVH